MLQQEPDAEPIIIRSQRLYALFYIIDNIHMHRENYNSANRYGAMAYQANIILGF